MKLNIFVIFDDSSICQFYPNTLTKSVAELVIGTMSQKKRFERAFDQEDIPILTQKYLQGLYKIQKTQTKKTDEQICFVNSRLKITKSILKAIESMPSDSCLVSPKGEIICLNSNFKRGDINRRKLNEEISTIKKQIVVEGAHLWQNLCEIVANNSKVLVEDFEDYFYDKENLFDPTMGVVMLNPYKVWIGKGVKIQPYVVLDATQGAVMIDDGVRINSNTTIKGPCYIGKNSVINSLSKIEGGTTIGVQSRVGGEIKNTIFEGYSNKQHDGFLGHSYIGKWVNIGAGSTNSNLKNNYSNVKVYSYKEKKQVDSKELFMGCLIGDYTKIGINCSINTGSVIGCGCSIYGSNLITGFVPSFSFGKMGYFSKYDIKRLKQTTQIVKKRRGQTLKKQKMDILTELYGKEC